MSSALARLWARKIHDGKKTVTELRDKYGDDGYAAVKEAYFELYGEDLDAID